MDNKLGQIILTLRKKKNLTQKELADNLGISDKAVSRWETGNSFPNLEMLFRISKYFKVSFNDLLTARMEDDNTDDELMHDIIKEFTEMNKKNIKRIKIILTITIIIITILVAIIIFTQSYNKFNVYTITFESKDISTTNGVYVETKIKDTFYLGNIKLNNIEIKNTDTVSVDVYYLENKKENIIFSSESLNNFNFSNYQSYIKIDDLSKYFDKLYIEISVIDSKNNVKKYKSKLKFSKDFSNNKIIYKEDNNELTNNTINLSQNEIIEILLKNKFKYISDGILSKEIDDYRVDYIIDTNRINFSSESNNFDYRYIYYLNENLLKVSVFDSNNVEIENYKYDITNNKVIDCVVGKCNSYKDAMKLLNKNILNLLKK